MLKSTSLKFGSYVDEKNWCPVYLDNEKEPAHHFIDELPLPTPISISIDSTKADPGFTTTPSHRVRQEDSESTHPFTFRCRPRPFPVLLITPSVPADPLLSCPLSPPSSHPSTDNLASVMKSTPHTTTTTATTTEAGPSISSLQDSLVACSIESITRESYSTLSKRRYGFDTSLSNVQYGYGPSKPYRFTSPLSPDPKIRKRSKIRKHKQKSAPNSLLQKTLRRNHADALRKRYPLTTRPINPPSYDFLPSLDDDDEDEFDDDEDDEIIDDFDVDDDAQVDDIVDLYNQRNPLPEQQDVCHKVSYMRGQEPEVAVTDAEDELILSSSMMTDPTTIEPVSLKPVLEETGAFVYVAHDSSDY